MRRFLQDVRFFGRMLTRYPAFAFVAVFSLALGVGANTAVFSIVNAVFLRPLAYSEPDRLMKLNLIVDTQDGKQIEIEDWSYPHFREFERQAEAFEQAAAYYSDYLALRGPDSAERIKVEYVSDTYFRLLGVQALQGRTFLKEEAVTPGESAVVLLSYSIWNRLFGGDPEILERTIRLDDIPFRVTGVMPAEFDGVSTGIDVWVPVSMVTTLVEPSFFSTSEYFWLRALGRLRPATSLQAAQGTFPALGAALKDAFPEADRVTPKALPLRQAKIDPGIRQPLGLLMATVFFVMLIACANVANLLLSRSISRRQEIGTRLAMGAPTGRLVQQFLTEGALLGLLGGGAGLLVAWLAVDGLGSIVPGSQGFWRSFAQAAGTVSIDFNVLGFTLALALASGLIFGLAPILTASRTDIRNAIAEGALGTAGSSSLLGRFNPRTLLVIAQIGLALVLLAGAGLMIRTLHLMRNTDPGFVAKGVLTARFQLPSGKYEPRDFFVPILERTRGLPGVVSTSVSTSLPLSGASYRTYLAIDGEDENRRDFDARRRVIVHIVDTDYFKTLSIPLLQGRPFMPTDRQGAPQAVLVNQSAAESFWPSKSAVGERIGLGIGHYGDDWAQVVGVAKDVHYWSVERQVRPEVYVHYRQVSPESVFLLIRSSSDPLGLVDPLRREVKAFDPEIPIYAIRSMQEVAARSMSQERFLALLLGGFAVVAITLAASGIFGAMAYSVSMRGREFGIRMALGANKGTIFKLVLKEGLLMTVAGTVAGLGTAFALSSYIESQLYGVSSSDPISIGAAVAGLAAVALCASYMPARRATKVDPIIALRFE